MFSAALLAVSALLSGPLTQSTPPADATPADVAVDAFGAAVADAGYESNGNTPAEDLATDEVFQQCLGIVDDVLLADPSDPDDVATVELGLTSLVTSEEFELAAADETTTDPAGPAGEEFTFAVAWTVDDDHVGELDDAVSYFGTAEADDCLTDATTTAMSASVPEGSVPGSPPFIVDVSATDLDVGDHSGSLTLYIEDTESSYASTLTFDIAQVGNVGLFVVRGVFTSTDTEFTPTDGGNALDAMVDAVS